MPWRSALVLGFLTLAFATASPLRAAEFEQSLKPLFTRHCIQCHGQDEANAEINLQKFDSRAVFLEHSELIERVREAIDTGAMPPDGEPPLDSATRKSAVAALTSLLRESTAKAPPAPQPLRRLNRFQYNNTVRDLFQLNRDVFALPERLMTRYDDYLPGADATARDARLPDTVRVACHSLQPLPGLQGVKPFPKDLRAEHGFDNQANQLTLSPLLLDAFLRLSVSIVESPDFNPQTVGIWDQFFAPPADTADHRSAIRQRLARFLRRAFRGRVEPETLDRYSAYAAAQIERGLPFPEAMKKVAAAVLSSPLFLYRASAADPERREFELASRLSYFLWGSCPDDELLQLAELGRLSQPEVLDRTVGRMLADPRIERFLDSFPAQWMQLENLLAATPDPKLSPYFHLDANAPASLQMVLEPLLLFDAVFLEDRPIIELVDPPFSYQSQFLRTWYTSDLQPPPVDRERIAADNRRNEARRQELRAEIMRRKAQLEALVGPVRQRLLEQLREQGGPTPVDLKPYAAWEFEGDLRESLRGLDLTAHGDVAFRDGMVVLDRSYLLSQPLPIELREKSLEVWFQLPNLDQRGGGLMGIQGPGDFFDTIVIGERQNRHWISGSNGFSRTDDFAGSEPETVTDRLLHLVMVYDEDGTTTLYRNGEPYGKPFNKGRAAFPRQKSSVIFGLRHLPPGGNKFLSVALDRARLYDRALTSQEVAASAAGAAALVNEADLLAALTAEQQAHREELLSAMNQAADELQRVPVDIDPQKVAEEARRSHEAELRRQLRSREFHRVDRDDPRYGGIITNAAMLSMTSGPKRTHPVARGVWIIEVLFNSPPPPPPNNVPPLDEEAADPNLTIREQFARHRENPSCAGCHSKLDPLGFALENFDITGRWRETYENGRAVDASGMLLRKHAFNEVSEFKAAIVTEQRRFARAFTEHLLRFGLARELSPADSVAVDRIVQEAERSGFRLRSLLRSVVLSDRFQGAR